MPGIEPGTSVLSGLRSSRLSYTPRFVASAADLTGIAALNPRRVKGRLVRLPLQPKLKRIDLGVCTHRREPAGQGSLERR